LTGKAADRLGLEGIISKRPQSCYYSGKTVRSWLKAKTLRVDDYEVIGVEKSRTGIPVALLARGDLSVGDAMIGLGGKAREAFWRKIDALGTPQARLAHLHKRKGGAVG
jgi:ATP-dependent DNA ligase